MAAGRAKQRAVSWYRCHSLTGVALAVAGDESVSLAAAALDVGAQVTLGVLAHATRLVGGLGADRGEDLFGRCARRGELALGRVSRLGADARSGADPARSRARAFASPRSSIAPRSTSSPRRPSPRRSIRRWPPRSTAANSRRGWSR
jgi:hypothetical protein